MTKRDSHVLSFSKICFLSILLLFLSTANGTLFAQAAVPAEYLTERLLSLAAEHEQASPGRKAQILPTLLDVAATRQQLLAELIETDPAEALRLAVSSEVRGSLPPQAQKFIEQESETEGELEIFHEDRDQESRYLYFLKTARERISLHFAHEPPTELPTGSHVRVRGVQIGQALALDSGGTSVEALSVALPNTFGAQKTIMILVNFQDNPVQPYTLDYAKTVFTTTSNFDLENSYQQTWLTGEVFGWYTIPLNSTTADTAQIATLAKQAAAAHGVDLSVYNRFVYAFPQVFAWWGMGTVGGNPSQAWINGSLQLKVVGHEMGHNLGLYHSHNLNCGTTTLGPSCSVDEYGDTIDIMGNPSAGHYNSFQKEYLGWLNYGASPPITTVQAGGLYSLAPYETFDSDPKALKILKSIDPLTGNKTWYYVEYRPAIGFDSSLSTSSSNVRNGVVIRTGSESNANSSYLLDMTPASSLMFYDPALTIGKSYYDPGAGFTIVPLSVSSTGASVSVTFDGSTPPPPPPPPVCAPANPTVALSPSATVSLPPGGTASYTVTVTNNDSSSCSASTFSLSKSFPTGWTVSLASSNLGVAPGASATTTLQVTVAITAAAVSYTIGVGATNTSNTAYFGAATVSVSVLPVSLTVAVSTNKPSYPRNQAVTVTATVNSGGLPVSGTSVNFTIKKSNGTSVAGSALTGTSGKAVYKYRLTAKDPVGAYSADAKASVNGASATNSTSFTVQ
jgi:hypothetical protein